MSQRNIFIIIGGVRLRQGRQYSPMTVTSIKAKYQGVRSLQDLAAHQVACSIRNSIVSLEQLPIPSLTKKVVGKFVDTANMITRLTYSRVSTYGRVSTPCPHHPTDLLDNPHTIFLNCKAVLLVEDMKATSSSGHEQQHFTKIKSKPVESKAVPKTGKSPIACPSS
eukprot:GFUD01040217.1.p1 GENE.GFUD01040217.1~~GFUD01040217.1.p1  ORF type:complete len:166 (-),score=35.84 GFUD01040217.1:171-668(-)